MNKPILTVIKQKDGSELHSVTFQEVVDKTIYQKTDKEKEILAKLKSTCVISNVNSIGEPKKKLIDHKGTLKIYLKPKWRRPREKRNDFKSVIVIKCYPSEINSYLEFARTYYGFKSSTRDEIVKYQYYI